MKKEIQKDNVGKKYRTEKIEELEGLLNEVKNRELETSKKMLKIVDEWQKKEMLNDPTKWGINIINNLGYSASIFQLHKLLEEFNMGVIDNFGFIVSQFDKLKTAHKTFKNIKDFKYNFREKGDTK